MDASEKLDVIQGTLDLLILQTLQWGPQHGHGIGQVIRAKSDDLLQVEHGSLYPALHRLRREGWIESDWGTTQNNQRAKFYRLTAQGETATRARRDPVEALRENHGASHAAAGVGANATMDPAVALEKAGG